MELTADCTAEIVKVVRKHVKMNRSQFARAVGVDRHTVTYWERGERTVLRVHKEAIAAVVDIDPDLLWPDPQGSRFNLEAP